MGKYKLTYFDLRARAEPIRLLLAVADQDYEDHRIDRDTTTWSKLKPKTYFQQLPIFEGDGIVLAQSNAIGRYLANKLGFADTTPQERAKADMLVDSCEDLIKPFLRISKDTKDEQEKAEAKKKFQEEDLPKFLGFYENILKDYNNGDTYFIRDSITWADLAIYHWTTWFALFDIPAPFEKFPKLDAFVKRVAAHPKVAAWCKKRPQTTRA